MSDETIVVLTIIIPVYNSEEFIEDCIDSIFDLNDKNELEIIIIDDASTDRSVELIRNKISSLPKVKFYLNKKNKGLSISRNIGIQNAIGKYVMFLDSDDLVVPDEILKLLNYAKINNLDLIEFKYKIFSSGLSSSQNKEYFLDTLTDKNLNILNGKVALENLLNSNKYDPVAWNKIYELSLIKENNLFFIENLKHEDTHWTPRIYSVAKRVFLADNIAYLYRINPNSITNSNNINSIIKRQSDIIEIAIMNIDYFRLENFPLKKEIYDWTARSIMFAAALSPSTYQNSKILPLTISRRTTTVLKSIVFAFSVNLYTNLKFRKKKYVKN